MIVDQYLRHLSEVTLHCFEKMFDRYLESVKANKRREELEKEEDKMSRK